MPVVATATEAELLAASAPVGVDLEEHGRPRDHLAIARAVHAPAQCEQLAALPLHVLILDEAQYIKNPSSKAARPHAS